MTCTGENRWKQWKALTGRYSDGTSRAEVRSTTARAKLRMVDGDLKVIRLTQRGAKVRNSNNVIFYVYGRMRWAGHVARMGEERGSYKVLVGKPEGKRPLGRPRRRWVDNIRIDLQEVGCGHVDWIGLAQDRDGWGKLVNAVMNLRVL